MNKGLRSDKNRNILARFNDIAQKQDAVDSTPKHGLRSDRNRDVLARFAREDDVHGNKFGVLRKQDETCPTIPAGEDLLLKALRAPTNHEPDQPHVPDIAEETILPVVKKKLSVSAAPIAAPVSLIDNEYALAQYVKKLIPMAIIGGHLYLFQPPCFCLLYTSRCV